MTVLDRYIGLSLIKGWLLVLLVVLAIFGLLAFVDELGRVNNRYQVFDAFWYVCLTMPRRMFDLAPVIALLGTLIALASMAKNSELTVIWSAGFALGRFVQAVLKPTLALVMVLALAAEFIVPTLYQHAQAQRAIARSGHANLLTGAGLWTADGDRFTNVRTFRLGYIPEGIDIYQFDKQGQLLTSIHAEYAHVGDKRHWVLFNVDKTDMDRHTTKTSHLDHLEMGPLWSAGELPGLSLSSEGLSLSALYSYATHLQSIGQAYQRYQLTFWQQLLMPWMAAVMVLLATPISLGLGSSRSRSFEIRLVAGGVIGILFYLGNPIIYSMGSLLKWYAPLIAALPLWILLAMASVFWFRCRV